MYLCGWKYEGRKIADKLHEQMLGIVEILNDKSKVAGRNWPALQKYISAEMGIEPGQVRTIKRMMEEFGIIKKGALNACEVPEPNNIYTKNGHTFVELLATEKLMRQNLTSDNLETINEIKEIYKLYYQKVLVEYCYNDGEDILHPLRATLKALKKYYYLNYWEWYILNTVVKHDDNATEEAELDRLIIEYRSGRLCFKETDIIENMLSHSYVLGNFEYAGFVCVEGRKTNLKITLNKDEMKIIEEIIK